MARIDTISCVAFSLIRTRTSEILSTSLPQIEMDLVQEDIGLLKIFENLLRYEFDFENLAFEGGGNKGYAYFGVIKVRLKKYFVHVFYALEKHYRNNVHIIFLCVNLV